jgi:hypothetical protein
MPGQKSFPANLLPGSKLKTTLAEGYTQKSKPHIWQNTLLLFAFLPERGVVQLVKNFNY